jgi:hypothetical protein
MDVVKQLVQPEAGHFVTYTLCRANLDSHFWVLVTSSSTPLRSVMTVSVALRNAAVHLYLNYTRSLRRVVDMLGRQFSKSALHNWLRCHPATRQQHHRRPAAVKVTERVESFLATCIHSNPFHTMASWLPL